MVKKYLLLFMGLFFACLYPLEAHADAMPDVIRYEELETLVKASSPQIQMEQAQYDSRLARYENAREEIMETRRLLREEAEDLEKNGDKDSAGQYRAQAKTLEDAAKDMDKQIRSAQGSGGVHVGRFCLQIFLARQHSQGQLVGCCLERGFLGCHGRCCAGPECLAGQDILIQCIQLAVHSLLTLADIPLAGMEFFIGAGSSAPLFPQGIIVAQRAPFVGAASHFQDTLRPGRRHGTDFCLGSFRISGENE